MKQFRKVLALALMAAMILIMGAAAFADKNDSVTVNNTRKGEMLKLYKMMDLVVDDEENPSTYKYTITEAWKDFFTTGDGKAYVVIDEVDGHVNWSESKDQGADTADMIAFGKAAAAYAKDLDPVKSEEAQGNSVVFEGLTDGYYLITSSLGTRAIIETTPDKEAVTVNEKNPDNTIEKKVKEDDTFGEESDAQIGDQVDFKTTVTLQPYTRNVKVHDTMDAGLAFNNDIAIDGLTAGTDYEVLNPADSGDTFTIKFTDTYLDSLKAEKKLEITYSAVLGTAAVSDTPALADQKNTTKLTYGDKQSATAETVTKTHKFSVHKHADGETKNLAGAVFKLKKDGTALKLTKIDAANYRVDPQGTETTFTTISTADTVIWGVDTDGTYTLEETDPPSGYNNLSGDIAVTVNADNSTVVDIENESGTELPVTGGMGTTLFYVIGAILVIGAGILLIVRRRSRS